MRIKIEINRLPSDMLSIDFRREDDWRMGQLIVREAEWKILRAGFQHMEDVRVEITDMRRPFV